MTRLQNNTASEKPAAAPKTQAHLGKVYCPMCTHTVDAIVEHAGKRAHVQAGQKCPRCSAGLDAGFIFFVDRAA